MRQAVAGYEQMYQLGRKAYHKGLRCIPVNDMEYMEYIRAKSTGKPATVEGFRALTQLAEAWIGGWTVESLRAI